MPSKIRWGILGPGAIAHSFAEDLKRVEDAQLVAVGSRDAQRARRFAQKFDIPHAFDSYQALARFEELDVIYIATPHSRHYEDMLLCLEFNKHILCEKSFTINARQAKEVLRIARQKKLFVMEAMWTRFLPVIFKLRQLLQAGEIGRLIMMTADLGFNFPFHPEHRVFNPHLGGGALLDVGIYPLSLCHYLMGVPDELTTLAYLGQTNVDELASVIFKYQDGRMANLYASLRSHTPSDAVFMGTEGVIRLLPPLYRPTGISLKKAGQQEQLIKAEWEGNGYLYEAREVGRCLKQGKLESAIMPHEDTIIIMELMDSIRAQWGLTYPMEAR
ncbi:oxidoreductase domain protein [Caldithrix abyssi DSM 13497]|uniref:Oxidoreductase domain protein n=1 Tax=Caldithrix abyssi DSM 13497 TaxID=880073 RepID=H1XRQ6_CALAY|nr:Gfo/Idh/MocA family oxidoreductase [Caldithrix abyssi]APF17125.1 putative dehydrogenase [Caldithrix abyssi DSM 13497]EHO41266.1 oxidoreductase domain protein [Caldithrix abyssi DSM 13497]